MATDVTSSLAISDYEKQCFMTKKRQLNLTGQPSLIPPGYEGIPEILIMNIFVSVIVILIFSVLRKKAWHYGRLALLYHKRSVAGNKFLGYNVFARITQSVNASLQGAGSSIGKSATSGSASSDVTSKDEIIVKSDQSTGIPKSSKKFSHVNKSTVSNVKSAIASSSAAELQELEKVKKGDRMTGFLYSDQGWFSWIKLMLTMTDDLIVYKCGMDSIYYTMFQRRIILYMLIISTLAITTLLPIHLTGQTNGTSTLPHRFYFARTTIANLAYESELLWFHCILLVLFNIICVFLMRNFAKHLPASKDENEMPSIMIKRLNKSIVGRDDLIRRYFHQAYPKYKVRHVKFAYDVKELVKCQIKLKNAMGAFKAASKDERKPMMRVRPCSKEKILCTDYYGKQADEYSKKFQQLRQKAEQSPLPICFVTFTNTYHSSYVLKNFHRIACGPIVFSRPPLPKTKLDSVVKPNEWIVVQAPDPDDIQWENLAVKYWYIRAIALNICVFLMIFFLTTPSYGVLLFDQISDAFHIPWSMTLSVILDGIAIVLLIALACLFPFLVSLAEWLCNHTTRSYENLMIMRKVTFFLLLMVLIFPSISVPSANVLTGSFITPRESNTTVTWGCIFVTQSGAFYTIYVISTALISMSMEFLRPIGLLVYFIRRLYARSKFERFQTTWVTVGGFPFGDNYAWMLLVFAISTVYGVFFPLILPAGLAYFIFKYYADRYNLVFVYMPNKILKQQHVAAMNFVFLSFQLAHFVLFLYASYSTSLTDFKALFMLVVLMFSLIGFVWHLIYGWMWHGLKGEKRSSSSADDSSKKISATKSPKSV